MRVFKDLELVEYLGSGLPRILKAYSSEVFGFTENFLRITFVYQQKSSGKSSGKTEDQIIMIIMQNPDITIPEIAAALGLSTRAIEKQISKLKDEGKLIREGPAKGGRWRVMKKDKS